MSIRTFANTDLEDLFYARKSPRIGPQFHKRLLVLLDALDAATGVGDLIRVRDFHRLAGDRARTYAMSITANWRLAFRFEHGTGGDTLDVDFEDYH
jgi:toxin HigB-1